MTRMQAKQPIAFCLMLILLLPGSGCERQALNTPSETARKTSLQRGIAYLVAQQSSEGLWMSPNYGNLKDGAAMTAFVMYALSNQDFDNRDSILQAGVERLAPQVLEHGFVTNPGGPDYSNYGSAMLLLTCRQSGLEIDPQVEKQLVAYLGRAQLDEEEGFAPDHPDYGGWDLSGWMTGTRPTTGTNISVSSVVIEAISRYRHLDNVALALKRSESWITGLQNRTGDGGFFFHPRRDHDGNKAGWADGNARNETRSYGTATADGITILSTLGRADDDSDLQAAVNWIAERDDLTQVPGFEHEAGEASWAHGLKFYYYQSLARCLPRFSTTDARKMAAQMIEQIESTQRADGSWSNPNARMREDDPLIATGFAIMALRQCYQYLAENR